jgi:hypothetical protein
MVTPTWDTRRPIDSRSPVSGRVLRELLGSPLCNMFGSTIPEIRMARIVASRVATARLTGRPHCTAWRCELIQLASSGVHIALVENLTHHLQQDSSVMTNIPLIMSLHEPFVVKPPSGRPQSYPTAQQYCTAHTLASHSIIALARHQVAQSVATHLESWHHHS